MSFEDDDTRKDKSPLKEKIILLEDKIVAANKENSCSIAKTWGQTKWKWDYEESYGETQERKLFENERNKSYKRRKCLNEYWNRAASIR